MGCFKRPHLEGKRIFTDFVVRDDGGGVAISVSVYCDMLVGLMHRALLDALHNQPIQA